jgi:hypothetical protein
MQLDTLTSCAELTMEHAQDAASSASAMRAFLTWATAIARPGECAPKVLMAIARLAHADWLDGTPYIEIRGDESTTTLSVFSDHGLGIRERVVPLARFPVSFDEFARAVRLAPKLVAPLEATQRGDAVYLTPPSESEEPTKTNHKAIRIDDKSLHAQERRTAPPPPHGGKNAPAAPPAPQPGVHTHPTVRRMVAVTPEAFRGRNDESD